MIPINPPAMPIHKGKVNTMRHTIRMVDVALRVAMTDEVMHPFHQ
jgi:hypothetical protein